MYAFFYQELLLWEFQCFHQRLIDKKQGFSIACPFLTALLTAVHSSDLPLPTVGKTHRNNRHRMRAPISCQSKNCRHKMADL